MIADKKTQMIANVIARPEGPKQSPYGEASHSLKGIAEPVPSPSEIASLRSQPLGLLRSPPLLRFASQSEAKRRGLARNDGRGISFALLAMTSVLICVFNSVHAEETEHYDASESVKEGREVILKQKKELEVRQKTEEEKAQMVEEAQEEARREIYEQKIVEEVEMPRPITTIERQLQRERYRREIMAQAGKMAEVPFRLRKRFNLRASETYDDNVFLTKVDKNPDYITKLSPSILFSLSSKFITLDVNYVLEVTRYKEQKKQGGISHLFLTYIRPGSIPFLSRKRGKLGFEIQNDFQPLVTSVASSEQTRRTERTSNRFFLTADYYMSTKRTLSLEYTNIFQTYKSTALENFSYTENIISPIFYFHIRPKWSLLTGYEYGIVDYSKGANSSIYQRIKTGLTGTLLTKVLSHFEVGTEWRRYEDSNNGEAQKIFFKSALIDKFTPATTGTLQYSHGLVESTYGSNPYYISDDVNFNLEHKFTYKTTGIFGLGYSYNTYDRETVEDGATGKRRDKLWKPSIGLRYYLKRKVSFDLNYIYKKKTSNFGKFDYVDNAITGGVNIKF